MPTLGDLAALVGAEVQGDPCYEITAVAPLSSAGPEDIAFLSDGRLRHLLAESKAGAVILSPADARCFSGRALRTANPYAAYARIMQYFYPAARAPGGIHHSAQIARDVQLDPGACIDAYVVVGTGAVIEADVWLEAGVFVGEEVHIGRGTHLYPGVKVYARCEIGPRCVIHAGAVIGGDGFGFAEENGVYLKIPHIGRVRIGADVEIGANSCIDRGALEDTRIGDGVKIDNLVQIGHNVEVGAHTVIAGQTGIAGSTRLGRHCRVGGQVGINGHIDIADHTAIAGRSSVVHHVRQAGVYSSVLPAQENRRWRRTVARIDDLDGLFRRVKRLEQAAGQAIQASREHTDSD
ncbi:MAG: UDP-3-O-(3-hydroxymyristoyl)glucosamine N-acyltransferase [Acidithiobacillus sp.]